ncbi:MAG: histidine kinase [Clostridia bacterium]|nr:histidine kinase [Clostridia bacterium]
MKQKSGSILKRIRSTLVIPFLCFILISSLLMVFYRDRALREIEAQYQYEDRLLAQGMEEEILNTKNCTNMIIIHLNEMMTDEYLDENLCAIPNARTQMQVGRCMLDAFTTFANLNQILIVWNNGAVFYEDWTTNFFISSGSGELLTFLSSLELTRYGTWFPDLKVDEYMTGDGPVFAKTFTHVMSGKQTGYILLKVSPIFASLEDVSANRYMELRDGKGRVIRSSEGREVSDRHRLFLNQNAVLQDWVLQSRTDLSEDIRHTDSLVLWVLGLNTLLLLMVYLITHHLLVRMIRPVKQLSDHMAGSLQTLPRPTRISTGNDEIGVLVSRFNAMTEHNQYLVGLLLEEKKHQEQLKLSLLQAQIKPHFLYNTLDTIYCLSEMGQREEASRTTKLLSDYYRHVLSHGLECVTLQEEITHVKDYLEIQSIRYSGMMEYRILQDDELPEIQIPKLTLQPLVENAIYHGIKPLGRKGHLTVSIHCMQPGVEIRIIDDGAGFSQAELECILAQPPSQEAGFGLKNVYERLRLYYADAFSLCVESMDDESENAGTCLLLCLPGEKQV